MAAKKKKPGRPKGIISTDQMIRACDRVIAEAQKTKIRLTSWAAQQAK